MKSELTKREGAGKLAKSPSNAEPALVFGRAWDYAPAPESADHVKIAPRYGLFIGGKWKAPQSGKYFATVSPSTEQKLAEVADANARDVDDAVRAARTAYDKYWSKMGGAERSKYIFRIARAIQEKARELAIVESMDGGKPIKESRDVDIPLAAAHFFYHAGWADKLAYAFQGRRVRPLGVAGQIIPWNFPLLMAAWKIAPALACGNTVVLKPAETTPLTALLLAKIIEEAELPPGVVNVLTGAGETGAALASHADVNKVAFTGSTDVGRKIQRALAGTSKRLTLELGGKAANIVFADAPIDQTIEGIVNGIYFNQGHVCCAGSRLLVEESVHDLIVKKLRDRISTLRLGDPLDKNTDVGAINSKMQLERIKQLVEAGSKEGAERYSSACALPSKGYWFPPTFFTGASQSSRIAREEIFGPVLTVLTFRTPEEALEKANNSMYGLSAGIWTDKGAKIFWMAQRLKAGVVWGNTYNKFDPSSPFGGYKESGFGREGGRQGLSAYVEVG
ncbi:aldehyde dehydrogenase family protein [Pendulispora rubella]|uniref:Aldehyde dehydrogenase family protein n=1 Tax=Pendulispora rubella TaxID=2741070 RepID=A0ABZ2LCM4_9BACT